MSIKNVNRSEMLIAVFVVILAFAASVLLLRKERIFHPLVKRHTILMTSAGLPLTHFFAGLPQNPKLKEIALHPNRGRQPTCQQTPTGTLTKLAHIVGFGQVVHAQGCAASAMCSCPAIIEEVTCSECDGSGGLNIIWVSGNDPTVGQWRTGDTFCSGHCCVIWECNC